MLAVVAVSLLAAGCGDDEDFANEPRPPKPIVVTSSVGADAISVSPSTFGAGQIMLKVVNQTGSSHALVLRGEDGSGTALEQRTAPINPNDATTVVADLAPGTYELATDASSQIRAARITVGTARPSAQDLLLQP